MLLQATTALPATEVPSGAIVLITIPLARPLLLTECRAAETEIQTLGLHRLYRLLAWAVLPDRVLVLVQSGPTPFQALLNLLRARLTQRIQHLIAPHLTEHAPTFAATVIPDAQALRLRQELLVATRAGSPAAFSAESPQRFSPAPVAMAA